MRKLDRVPQTLGEKLRALRRGQGVTLEVLERETHMQHRYIEALERGRYDELPEPMYTRNFIRAYARVLHADENYFLELYEEECGRCDLLDPMRLPRQRVRRGSFFNLPRAVTVAVVSTFVAIILGYFVWQFSGLVRPPEIVLFSPQDGIASDSALLEVRGEIKKGEVTLTINGDEVIVNADRTFFTTLDLERGLNVVTIEAKRRYSKPAVVYRRVVFEPKGMTEISSGERAP